MARLRLHPWRDRATAAAAFGWLLAAEAGLRGLGFPRTRRLMAPRRRLKAAGGAAGPAPAEIQRLVRLNAAACRAVYPAGCLPRAMVLERLLVGAGAPAELRIGVRIEEGRFEAHAWVELDGRPLGEPEGIELRFAPLEPTSTAGSLPPLGGRGGV